MSGISSSICGYSGHVKGVKFPNAVYSEKASLKGHVIMELTHMKNDAYVGAKAGAIMGIMASTLLWTLIVTSIPHRVGANLECVIGSSILFSGGVTSFAITGVFLSVVIGIFKR